MFALSFFFLSSDQQPIIQPARVPTAIMMATTSSNQGFQTTL